MPTQGNIILGLVPRPQVQPVLVQCRQQPLRPALRCFGPALSKELKSGIFFLTWSPSSALLSPFLVGRVPLLKKATQHPGCPMEGLGLQLEPQDSVLGPIFDLHPKK